MTAQAKPGPPQPATAKLERPTYVPYNPIDDEDRANDPDDGIDYEEILAATEAEIAAGKSRIFRSCDYPTEDALTQALDAYFEECRQAREGG